MNLAKLFKGIFRRKPPPPPRPVADPRLEQDPWLAEVFARLGDRYQLGEDGERVLRRTGRARFNPMPVWIKERSLRCDFEVRTSDAAAADARALLDARYGQRLLALGLSPAGESVEEWAGTVLIRSYRGGYDSAERASVAIRFVCEDSETQLNTAAE